MGQWLTLAMSEKSISEVVSEDGLSEKKQHLPMSYNCPDLT
jgi:hypothetical protein